MSIPYNPPKITDNPQKAVDAFIELYGDKALTEKQSELAAKFQPAKEEKEKPIVYINQSTTIAPFGSSVTGTGGSSVTGTGITYYPSTTVYYPTTTVYYPSTNGINAVGGWVDASTVPYNAPQIDYEQVKQLAKTYGLIQEAKAAEEIEDEEPKGLGKRVIRFED